VDTLFEAVSAHGPEAIAVLLTGLGKDGAVDLLAPRRGGGLTVGQEVTSVVFGMPREAIGLAPLNIS